MGRAATGTAARGSARRGPRPGATVRVVRGEKRASARRAIPDTYASSRPWTRPKGRRAILPRGERRGHRRRLMAPPRGPSARAAPPAGGRVRAPPPRPRATATGARARLAATPASRAARVPSPDAGGAGVPPRHRWTPPGVHPAPRRGGSSSRPRPAPRRAPAPPRGRDGRRLGPRPAPACRRLPRAAPPSRTRRGVGRPRARRSRPARRGSGARPWPAASRCRRRGRPPRGRRVPRPRLGLAGAARRGRRPNPGRYPFSTCPRIPPRSVIWRQTVPRGRCKLPLTPPARGGPVSAPWTRGAHVPVRRPVRLAASHRAGRPRPPHRPRVGRRRDRGASPRARPGRRSRGVGRPRPAGRRSRTVIDGGPPPCRREATGAVGAPRRVRTRHCLGAPEAGRGRGRGRWPGPARRAAGGLGGGGPGPRRRGFPRPRPAGPRVPRAGENDVVHRCVPVRPHPAWNTPRNGPGGGPSCTAAARAASASSRPRSSTHTAGDAAGASGGTVAPPPVAGGTGGPDRGP